jgi:RNA polymerase sigma factor (TIGR02999 family)
MALQTGAKADVVARLMRSLRQGSAEAKRELVAMLFPELRRLAAAKMRRERVNHTLQPTALVSELYLELLKLRRLEDRAYADEQEKAAFLGLAGQMMNRMLIHHARPLARRVERAEIDEALPADCGLAALNNVENALTELEKIDPRFRRVVEMKIFEGRTGEEIAQLLSCSPRTVAACWNFARNWLRKEWLEN